MYTIASEGQSQNIFDEFDALDGVIHIPMGRVSAIMGYVEATFRFHKFFQSIEMCGGVDDEVIRGAVWEHCRVTGEQLR